ncbi:hypothetical protein SODALDRAFT_109914 [Sodiomyces alkalinus F11]|uniref:Uncharacterized protein n=1 Tax=Sodiomyces alkalinus (strain CBS 110278 / VKM F-3762 / F11) TaxID=1314773 RepID=A0A3N2Q2M9_SODAK|nr:hypothetical protein SODALDRAFT_109914 [Sodiomyces alkalinus F11]ROT41021.1 hypothetical protein SODALDRAFT_109914 [Sodiomyces alkalinus F11]
MRTFLVRDLTSFCGDKRKEGVRRVGSFGLAGSLAVLYTTLREFHLTRHTTANTRQQSTRSHKVLFVDIRRMVWLTPHLPRPGPTGNFSVSTRRLKWQGRKGARILETLKLCLAPSCLKPSYLS